MTDVVRRLSEVLDSLGESAQFCTSGSFAPVLPGLEVEGIGSVGMPVTTADAKRLIKRASQAPYGRGEETIVDTDVRRVWQFEPWQFSLSNPEWTLFVAEIVDAVRKQFGIKRKVESELYKLLVYEKGSFFAPHRDTEKVPNMFATLVVGLPSQHSGGTLVVTHDGETKRIDFGGADSQFKIQYASFYADCQHEITPVTSGYRVCLVYNLSIPRQKVQPSAPASSQAVDEVSELLPQLFAAETRDKVVIPFKHQYTEAALDPRELKGADQARMAVLARAADRLGYQAFVALLTHFQSGSPDYDTIDYSRSRRRYRRFDGGLDDDVSGSDDAAEFEEVYDERRSLDCWLNPQGRKQPFGELSFNDDEVISTVPADEWSYTQQIHEATGNEGATLERWYRRAAVVIWPRDRYFLILAGEGPEHAVPALEELVNDTKKPDGDSACHKFARAIIERWERPKYAAEGSLPSRMLKLLDRIAAADLAARFVRDILPNNYDGTEGPLLTEIANRFGWANLADPILDFFSQLSPEDYRLTMAMPVSIFDALCTSPPALTEDRRLICTKLAAEVQQFIERYDRLPEHEDEWYYPGERKGRAEIIESFFHALETLRERERIEQFISHVLNTPKCYDLHADLIPAAKAIAPSLRHDSPGQASFERLREHCLAELRARTATPIIPPADWSREANIKCSCKDCQELVRFLRDPAERVHRFARRKDLRQHLHRQIDEHRLDVTQVTERKGSPQTLVCTKNQASYERRIAQFRIDSQLLAELEKLPSARSGATKAGRRSKIRKTKT